MEPEDKQVILNRYDKKVSTGISFTKKSDWDDIIRFEHSKYNKANIDQW